MLLEESNAMSTESPPNTSPSPTTRFQDHLLVALGDLEQTGTHEHAIPHGLAIKHEVEESDYGPTEVHHARLYGNLSSLDDDGFVEKSEIDGRTTGYQLTDAGRHYLTQAANRFVSAAPSEVTQQ